MKRQIGDRVKVINKESVHWFTGPHMGDKPMPITGKIVQINPDHFVGVNARAYLIKFDDGRESWYGTEEIRKI